MPHLKCKHDPSVRTFCAYTIFMHHSSNDCSVGVVLAHDNFEKSLIEFFREKIERFFGIRMESAFSAE